MNRRQALLAAIGLTAARFFAPAVRELVPNHLRLLGIDPTQTYAWTNRVVVYGPPLHFDESLESTPPLYAP